MGVLPRGSAEPKQELTAGLTWAYHRLTTIRQIIPPAWTGKGVGLIDCLSGWGVASGGGGGGVGEW